MLIDNNKIFHGLLMSAKLSHLLLLVPSFILRKESGSQLIPQSHFFLICNALSSFAESVAFVMDRFLHWGQKEDILLFFWAVCCFCPDKNLHSTPLLQDCHSYSAPIPPGVVCSS